MSETLLRTKLLVPPVRPNLIPRPQLIERLNHGLQFGHKLTFISAPAGFGKTTLVSEWVRALGEATPPIAIAWLSLDERDNDLVRFLAYLVAALDQVEGVETAIGKGVRVMLQSPRPPPLEDALTSLINDVTAIPDRIILILDDYHLIESSPVDASTSVDQALTFLLEHLPPQLHLVIATRVDPNLPLARYRARGQLTELRGADLRFTSLEAADYLNRVMGLDLSSDDVSMLESRTEGWIAGLQLAAISMQGRKDATGFIESFTGSHHFVMDYLLEDVLQQQPESVQRFLLQTAILDRLNSSLCDAVVGRLEIRDRGAGGGAQAADNLPGRRQSAPISNFQGQETLEYLEHANLFIVPLDEERLWYRYHHLFSELLRRRLRQLQPDWVPSLHQRASEWYEQNGFADEAIGHALSTEDLERAADLIENHVDRIWQRGEHIKLRRWLAGLPVELVFSRPHLCILNAWNLFTSGQQDAAERSLRAAEKSLESSRDATIETSALERDQQPGSDRMKIQGRAAAIRAFLAFYRGDVQEIYSYSHQALELLPKQDLTWRSTATVALGDAYSFIGEAATAYQFRLEALEASKAAGNIYMALIASMKLAVNMREQGQLEHVIEICQQQLQLANQNGLSQTAVVGWLLAIWGEVLAELNDLDRAIQHAKNGTELTGRGRDMAMIGWSNLCLMRVLFSNGDMAGAEETVQKMENIARENYIPPWITSMVAAWQARIWLAEDRLDAASQWVGERGPDADAEPIPLNEIEYIVLARFLITEGRLDEATTLLQNLRRATESGGRISRLIEILILQALAFQGAGESTAALAALERAFTLAEPRGFFRIFVDEGRPMARLLYQAVGQGISADYASRLLAALPVIEVQPAEPSQPQVPESVLVEPLSKRELEVLQLVAEGLTNREIADRLYLSLNTVKAHTRNIYGKLDVHSRTQAVGRAQELGLLSPRSL